MARTRLSFRQIVEWLHLWLGLLLGIVVFIVCLTGALWVFRYEVYYFTEPYQRVAIQQKAFLPPSRLIAEAKNYLKPDSASSLQSVTYCAAGRSASLGFSIGKTGQAELFFNPYTGQLLKISAQRTRRIVSLCSSAPATASFGCPKNMAVRWSVHFAWPFC